MEHVEREELYGCRFMLRRNYRSEPQTLELYNKVIYQSKLTSARSADTVNDNIQQRLYDLIRLNKFRGTISTVPAPPCVEDMARAWAVNLKSPHHETRYHSRWNPDADQGSFGIALDLISTSELHDDSGAPTIEPKDLTILTFYSKDRDEFLEIAYQVSRKYAFPQLMDVTIATVDSYQGEENRVVILPTISGHSKMGLIRDSNRLNMVLSRAMDIQIILRNLEILRGTKPKKASERALVDFLEGPHGKRVNFKDNGIDARSVPFAKPDRLKMEWRFEDPGWTGSVPQSPPFQAQNPASFTLLSNRGGKMTLALS